MFSKSLSGRVLDSAKIFSSGFPTTALRIRRVWPVPRPAGAPHREMCLARLSGRWTRRPSHCASAVGSERVLAFRASLGLDPGEGLAAEVT